MNTSRQVLTALLACLLATGAALADQRTFRLSSGEEKTFFGYLQYCNPAFLQCFVGQQGSKKPVELRVMRGRKSRSGSTDWTQLARGMADQSNAEGETVLGFRCGYSANFRFPPGLVRPDDLIHVQIARTAEGRRAYWTFFDRTIGEGGQRNTDPNKGESQGGNDFQGRITAIRPDSIRGYAADDYYLAGGRGRVYYPVKVQLELERRKIDTKEALEKVEEVTADAGEKTELPLDQTDAPGDDNSTWNVGFTANLAKRLEPGYEYQITLSQTSLGREVLDKRVYRVVDAEAVPVLASYSIGKGANGDGGAELELVNEWKSKVEASVLERMTARALISKDEFYRKTPRQSFLGDKSGWRARPDYPYKFKGAGDSAGFFGNFTEFKRSFLPPPKGALDIRDITRQGEEINLRNQGIGREGKPGGYTPEGTRSLWVQIIADNPDPEKRKDAKVYLYEWTYAEPFFERFVIALFRNTRLKELGKTWQGLSVPVPAPGTPVDPDDASATSSSSATQSSTGLPNSVTNGYITIFLTDARDKPVPWKKLDGGRREAVMARHGARLDEEFNTYKDVEFGVGVFSKKQLESNPLGGTTTNPSAADSKMAMMTFKLKGDHADAWYDDPSKGTHPLFVSVRYVYDKGVEAILHGPASTSSGSNPVDDTGGGPPESSETPPDQ